MVKTIAHMILEEDDVDTGKHSMKCSKSTIVALIASMTAVIALGLAAKALSDVSNLRIELAMARKLATPPGLVGSPSNYQILRDDSKIALQNASTPIEEEVDNQTYASEDAVRNLQSLLIDLQRKVNTELKNLNTTTQSLQVRLSKTTQEQTALMNTVANLSSELDESKELVFYFDENQETNFIIFNDSDEFHHIRGQAFIQQLTFLLQKDQEFSAKLFILKLNTSNNAENIWKLMHHQHYVVTHFEALKKYVDNETNNIWKRLDSIDSRLSSTRESIEENKESLIEEMHRRFRINSLEIQDLEERISMNRNSTLKGVPKLSCSLLDQPSNKLEFSALPRKLDVLRRAEDWNRNHFTSKTIQLRGDIYQQRVKTQNNTDEIQNLHSLLGRVALHSWRLSRATKLHEIRINATETHINNTRANNVQGITSEDALIQDVLDNAEQTIEIKKTITRLEKDFCEFVGLVYGGLCIRMAYAKGPDVNFTRGDEICQSQGGTLTDIENDVMIDLIADMVKSTYRGNAASVELWIGNTFQNGDVVTSSGQVVSLNKWHHRPDPAIRRSNMELYVDLDLGAPTGVFPVFANVPHFTPLCSFQFD